MGTGARVTAAVVVVLLVLATGVAWLLRLGPFAADGSTEGAPEVMSASTFGSTADDLRAGSLLEQHAVDVACDFFLSLYSTGAPPSGQPSFAGALAEVSGVPESSGRWNARVRRLQATVDDVQREPARAGGYAQYCAVGAAARPV